MLVWKKSQKGNEVQSWVAETKDEASSGLEDEPIHSFRKWTKRDSVKLSNLFKVSRTKINPSVYNLRDNERVENGIFKLGKTVQPSPPDTGQGIETEGGKWFAIAMDARM